MEALNVTAIITAAGSGQRLPGKAKKQFRELGGIPIIIRSLEPFFASKAVDNIIVTAPEDEVEQCSILIKQYLDEPGKPWLVIPGGVERQDSVFNALQHCQKDTGYVMVHDGVRPFVSVELIDHLLELCLTEKAVIPAARLKHTIKRIEGDYAVRTLPRQHLIQVFTPQVFEFQLLLQAYLQAYEDTFSGTDDASLVERLGHKVRYELCPEINIKITDELDLFMAMQIIENNMI